LRLAEEAWRLEPTSRAVLLTLASARTVAGDIAGAVEAARELEAVEDSMSVPMGHLMRMVMEASVGGSVVEVAESLDAVIDRFRDEGSDHFVGTARLNQSLLYLTMGEFDRAVSAAEDAMSVLPASPTSLEIVAARLARSAGLAFLGDIRGARDEYMRAGEIASPGQHAEIALEVGHLEALLGESAFGWEQLGRVADRVGEPTDAGEQLLYARLLLRVRDGELEAAAADAAHLTPGVVRSQPVFDARRHLAKALVALLRQQPDLATARHGTEIATRQGARLWVEYGFGLSRFSDPTMDPSATVTEMARRMPVVVSMLAEVVLGYAGKLDHAARAAIESEATKRPWRWRHGVRRLLATNDMAERQFAAGLLEQIGEKSDVKLLRSASRALRGAAGNRAGLQLARRLADRVMIEDLGRVRIEIGSKVVEGAQVRRKVLALLCLLVSRPGLAATREEVVDALWPDNDPSSALNSLNQTVYFLRRVFEPDYSEDASPGYVGQDGETVWLDADLVSARSRRSLDLIRQIPADATPEQALSLAKEYTGRFALDFAYEDWSSQYRDSLHAAYLRVMERAIHMDLDTGQFARGTLLAERAAEIDPDSDEVQVSLIKLYRMSGSHAAAAEQYGHYERLMKDMGLEATPLHEL
jgi:DNA-binding SARP family transcriptional activator